MSEREIRMLNNLDINKIDKNGRYVDVSIPLIFNLNYEQIQYLRDRYGRDDIAINMGDSRNTVREEDNVPSRSKDARYTLSREQKYNSGRHRTKKPVSFSPIGKIIVGVVVVAVAVGAVSFFVRKNNKDVKVNDEVVVAVEDVTEYYYTVENKLAGATQPVYVLEKDDGMTEESVTEEQEEPTETVVDEVAEPEEVLDERGEMIQEICNIYHVNFSEVYDYLKNVTNNFTNEAYLNGIIEGVTCKGEPVCASSERELLVYTIRCIKQLPGQLGINTDNLYTNNSYESSTDYVRQISKVCEDLGLDRCLMYAIVYSECNFNSEMFNNLNNPAGLRNDGEWWYFDTKEEGFYELGMEMLKYYRMIGKSPTDVDYGTIEEIRDIHAPLSDGNEFWLPNVIENYEYAVMNEATLFNDNMNRELSH